MMRKKIFTLWSLLLLILSSFMVHAQEESGLFRLSEWVNVIVDWSNAILGLVAIYFLWLVIKGGTEGKTHKDAWGLGKEGFNKVNPWSGERTSNRKLRRAAKYEKTRLLGEYVYEKEELGKVKAAKKKLGTFVQLLGVWTNEKEVQENWKEFTDALKEADDFIRPLQKVTYRQEQKGQRLTQELKKAGYKEAEINEIQVLEKRILEKHNAVVDNLDTANKGAGKITQQLKRGAYDSKMIRASCGDISTALTTVEQQQELAYQAVEGLDVKFRGIWKEENV